MICFIQSKQTLSTHVLHALAFFTLLTVIAILNTCIYIKTI